MSPLPAAVPMPLPPAAPAPARQRRFVVAALVGAALVGAVVLCALVALHRSAASGAISPAATPAGARLEPVPCWFAVGRFERVACARLVPSDAPRRETQISLPVVVLRGARGHENRAPLVYLTGGPGDASGLEPEDMPAWRAWHDALGHDNDLILLDPRGTGRATPRLDCPALGTLTRALLAQSPTPREEFDRSLAVLRACADGFAQQSVSLRDFSTLHSARDVAELLALLDVHDARLYGVSYGTRLALGVLRADPERIGAVVLDSVYPPDVDAFESWPAVLDGAFTRLLDGCAANAVCNTRYPALGTTLDRLLARLRDAPLALDVRDPSGRGRLSVLIDDRRVLSVLFDALYRRERIPALPAIIAAASEGRSARLVPLVEDWVEGLLSPLASDLVYNAVDCQDRTPRESRAAYLARVAAFPRVAFALRDDWDLDICSALGLPAASADVRAPVVSAMPTLLLGGAYDPVTPISFAQRAARTLWRATLAVLPDASHGVLDGDACARSLTRAFLAEPSRTPTLACVAISTAVDSVLGVAAASPHNAAHNADTIATDADPSGGSNESGARTEPEPPASPRGL